MISVGLAIPEIPPPQTELLAILYPHVFAIRSMLYYECIAPGQMSAWIIGFVEISQLFQLRRSGSVRVIQRFRLFEFIVSRHLPDQKEVASNPLTLQRQPE